MPLPARRRWCLFCLTTTLNPLARMKTVISWIARIIVAAIFVMAALPKFTGQEISVDTFTAMGVEPWGRYAIGLIEIAAAVLILIPKTVVIGALAAIAMMIGALISHATFLGFAMQKIGENGEHADGGAGTVMAIVVLVAALATLVIHCPLRGRKSA